jgi:hypothetical protein
MASSGGFFSEAAGNTNPLFEIFVKTQASAFVFAALPCAGEWQLFPSVERSQLCKGGFMKAMTKTLSCTLACTLLLSLSACGGGGDSAPTSSYDPSVLYGNWVGYGGASTRCTAFTTIGGNYYGSNQLTTIDATSLSAATTLYNDAACTSKAGKLTMIYSLATSAGSVSGKANVIRMDTVYTGLSLGRDGNGTGVTLINPPNTGSRIKLLGYVSGSNLFLGDLAAGLDSSGYPTALLATPTYSR